MQRGRQILASAAILVVAGCGGEQGKLQIRTASTPVATGKKPVPFRIAEAHNQIMLGNVALALESFRKAARQDPNNVDAIAGIAACYDRMGRFDLSRRYYESALAITPGDPHILGALAASLDMQGRSTEATAVRTEIVGRLAAAVPTPVSPAVDAAPSSVEPEIQLVNVAPRGRSVTIALAPPRPAPVASPVAKPEIPTVNGSPRGQSVTIALSPPRPAPPAPPPISVAAVAPEPSQPPIARVTPAAPPPIAVAAVAPVQAPQPVARVTPAAPPPISVAPVAPVQAPQPVARVTPAAPPPISVAPVAPMQAPQPVARVTPAAPPPIAVAAVAPMPAPPPADKVTPPIGRSVTTASPPPRPASAAVARKSGPRLERTSLGEVSLITASGPRWKAQMADRSGLRFVPLREASYNQGPVRLLNAARVHRLAARTRSYLSGRGWAEIKIGDAAIVRRRSLIVYSAGQRELAARLSAQTGYAMVERAGVRMVTILLGRDAARHPALSNLSS